MAEDKITITTLRKQLAHKTGVSEEVAGTFLSRLFPVIIAGLREDKQVRINGFGSFKLQWNEPRKSVNIHTGETITIDGYNKVVFTPETALKEQINEPFAHLETLVLEGELPTSAAGASVNPMQKFGEQAEEIKDILAELGGLSTEAVEEEETIAIVEEEVAEEETTEAIEETEEEPIIEEEPVETETTEEEITTTNINPEKVSTIMEETNLETNEERLTIKPKKNSCNRWLIAGIIILAFGLLLAIGFFFLQHQIVDWANSLLEKQSVEVVEEIAVEEIDEYVEEDAIPETEPRVYTEFIKTERLTPGSRLSWLSRKYYGAPDFWVYIYEANADIISNPNNIPIGTKIRVPKLPADLIDTNNAASMAQAHALHNEILGL